MSTAKDFVSNLMGNAVHLVETVFQDSSSNSSAQSSSNNMTSESSMKNAKNSRPSNNSSSCAPASSGLSNSPLTPSSHVNKCSSCDITFQAIIRRRRVCVYCGEFYCKTCVEPYNSGNSQKRWLCCRCVVFTRVELQWDALMKMKIKDLRWFLIRNRISLHGCTEKEQLVELIVDTYGSETYQRERQTQSQRACQLKMQMDELKSAEVNQEDDEDVDDADDNSFVPIVENPISQDNSKFETRHVHEMGDNSSVSSNPPAASSVNFDPPPPPPPPPPPAYETVVVESGIEMTSSSSVPIINYSDSQKPRSNIPPGNQRVPLQDILYEDDLELLSIKQIKDLLASNFVDYKGCVEKPELLIRVRRLWHSFQENKRLAESEEVVDNSCKKKDIPMSSEDNDNTCRICMDYLIDCVLLECGHMVTCVRCGKQMSECPICRQNVVRVVRIFRS